MAMEGRCQTDPHTPQTSLSKARLKASENEAVRKRTKKKLNQTKLNKCGCLSKVLLPHLKFKSLSHLSAFSIRRRNRTSQKMSKKTLVLSF